MFPVIYLTTIYLAASPAQVYLDRHLANWEAAVARATSYSGKFELTRTDAVFRKERKLTGSLRLLKPNLFRVWIWDAANGKSDRLYLFNGESIFEYIWPNKTVTELPLTTWPAKNLKTPVLDLFLNFKAAEATKRYRIEQVEKCDENYVYLNIKPIAEKDKHQFDLIRIALYGPNIPPPLISYLPVQIHIQLPNGDEEVWKFSEQQLNPKIDGRDIGLQNFQFETPAGDGWTIRKAPELNALRRTAPNLKLPQP